MIQSRRLPFSVLLLLLVTGAGCKTSGSYKPETADPPFTSPPPYTSHPDPTSPPPVGPVSR